LEEAILFSYRQGFRVSSPDLVQIPHHGSRRNVSPAILDYLLGVRLAEGSEGRGWAIASAAKDDDDHPRRVVLNARRRRGYNSTATKGITVNYRHQFPAREGWSAIEPFPLCSNVEK
jgi:hypothetical protein